MNQFCLSIPFCKSIFFKKFSERQIALIPFHFWILHAKKEMCLVQCLFVKVWKVFSHLVFQMQSSFDRQRLICFKIDMKLRTCDSVSLVFHVVSAIGNCERYIWKCQCQFQWCNPIFWIFRMAIVAIKHQTIALYKAGIASFIIREFCRNMVKLHRRLQTFLVNYLYIIRIFDVFCVFTTSSSIKRKFHFFASSSAISVFV